MKPVYQSIVCPERGDCQSAALASILELPIEQVPPFVARAFDEGQLHHWFDYQTAWLLERGLRLIDVRWESVSDWRVLTGVFCVASVPSQKYAGGWHAVVGTWVRDEESGAHRFRVAHDPRPDNAPYPDTIEPRRVSFLVPLLPRAA